MASSTENVKMGVCRAYFDGVDLGLTKGGVEVSVTTETYEVEVDQYGKTPIKEQITGRKVMVKVPMAETTLENIAALMPGTTIVGSGASAHLEATTGAGLDLLTVAKELRLHPLSKGPTDYSEDFVVYKAATPGAMAFAYKLDSERIFNADFKGYPDPVTGKLFAIGLADTP